MKKKLLYVSILMAVILFTGCAKTPSVNYNSSMHKDVKKIAIIPPNQKKELTVFYYNHPGINFGLVGGLIAEAEFSSKTSTYNKLVKPIKFNVNSYFIKRLVHYLKKEHYDITILAANVKREPGFMKEYPEVNTDGYLDLVIYNVGYVAGSPTATYKPTVHIAARMVKNKNKEIIYDKHISIGENFALEKEVDYLGCDESECHKDFDTLKQNALKSVHGLKKALDKIALRLALSLKRG